MSQPEYQEATICAACGSYNFIQDFESGEFICQNEKCGAVNQQATEYAMQEQSLMADGKKATAESHNAGNALLNSITPQAGYVSKRNPGLAMALCNTANKDAFGKGTKRQLVNGYLSGLFADKDWHTEIDPMTNKKEFKFSRYDSSLLKLASEVAEQLCTELHLDTVQKSHIRAKIKKMVSNLAMSELIPWMVYSALKEYQHWLTPDMIAEIDEEINYRTNNMRIKIVTRCNKDLMKQLKEQEKHQSQPIEVPQT